MRPFLVHLLLLGCGGTAFSAYQQQMIPIVREINTSSAPSVSEWRTFVRVADFKGSTYVSLVQMAELLDGSLRWHPVSKNVDLTVHNQAIRFAYNSPHAKINGQPHQLEQPTVKNDDGFWIPITFFASPAFYRTAHAKLQWPPPSEPAASSKQQAVPAQTTARSLPLAAHSIKRIVIDPGHGGKDPGAEGAHGVEEKTVNLLLAQKLADVLREKYDYEVLLTRTDDTFIPLEERAKLANKYNADLFISIHCNSSLSSQLKGFEVYFLSEYASDPHADAVARQENASLALEGKNAPSPDQVSAVLRSLVKTAYINDSSELGALIDRQVGERLSEPRLGVKQAGFYVLRGAEMPAILIETGFLSNANEEKLLRDSAFQDRLIDGIAAGITAYDERKQKERR